VYSHCIWASLPLPFPKYRFKCPVKICSEFSRVVLAMVVKSAYRLLTALPTRARVALWRGTGLLAIGIQFLDSRVRWDAHHCPFGGFFFPHRAAAAFLAFAERASFDNCLAAFLPPIAPSVRSRSLKSSSTVFLLVDISPSCLAGEHAKVNPLIMLCQASLEMSPSLAR